MTTDNSMNLHEPHLTIKELKEKFPHYNILGFNATNIGDINQFSRPIDIRFIEDNTKVDDHKEISSFEYYNLIQKKAENKTITEKVIIFYINEYKRYFQKAVQ